MEERDVLKCHLTETGTTVDDYAASRGVHRSIIYKFLGGKDIWVSTWKRIAPPSYQTSQVPSNPTPPADAGKE